MENPYLLQFAASLPADRGQVQSADATARRLPRKQSPVIPPNRQRWAGWVKMVKRVLGIVAVLGLLAGCQPGEVPGTARSVAVLGGAVSVTLPSDYCINRAAGREERDSAVVVMGRCSSAATVAPALVTVTVGPAASAGALAAGPATLAQFFASEAGRASLSRDGRAADIRILEALSSGGAFLLHLQDRQQGEYWRAIIGVRGRLVTVSASGAPGVPLQAAAGRRLTDQVVDGLRAANPS
jgi:hypothetical protein